MLASSAARFFSGESVAGAVAYASSHPFHFGKRARYGARAAFAAVSRSATACFRLASVPAAVLSPVSVVASRYPANVSCLAKSSYTTRPGAAEIKGCGDEVGELANFALTTNVLSSRPKKKLVASAP